MDGAGMQTSMRVTLLGLASGFFLVGCVGEVPIHSTPTWDNLIAEVQGELATITPVTEPDFIEPDPVEPAVTTGDLYAGLTTSSPNAVTVSLNDVAVGQCLLYPYDENGDLQDDIQVVPCGEPHYGEVFAAGQLEEGSYSDEIDGTIADRCVADFTDYVGVDYAASVLYFDYSYPSAIGWADGWRGWRCYAVEADYENAGTVRGSGR